MLCKIKRGAKSNLNKITIMKTILINVTKEDIEEGLSNDCYLCPIAVAIGRIIKDECRAMVHSSLINFYKRPNNKFITTVYLPATAIQFIKLFDSVGQGEPFSFNVNVEDEIAQELFK